MTVSTNTHDEEDRSQDPIYYPSLSDQNERTSDDEASDNAVGDLHDACRVAVRANRPLHLRASFLRLEEAVVLRKHERLTIVGFAKPTDGDHASSSTTIQGDLHSLFVLNNSSQLILRHVQLKHSLEPSPTSSANDHHGAGDHRQVGAAVNLRKKSSLQMQHGSLHSACGFCLWTVQKSSVVLHHCRLHATLRSPLVCFGQPTVTLKHCQIVDAGVHGLCARGEAQLWLEDCTIRGSAGRAIYAYAQASVTLTRTKISGTLRRDKAAIEVSAAMGSGTKGKADNDDEKNPNAPVKASKKGKSGHLKIPPKSTLIMTNCKVYDNQGIGVLIRGDVDCKLDNVEWSENVEGDYVETTALQDDDDDDDDQFHDSDTKTDQDQPNKPLAAATTNNTSERRNGLPPTTISGLKRDPTGSSSFRQGDWWCPKCYQDWYYCRFMVSNPAVVMAGNLKCPTCGYCAGDQRPQHDLGLTVSEIATLNRGQAISIRQNLIRPLESNVAHRWMFDGDDKGWIPYDETSNGLLEDAFQEAKVLPQAALTEEVMSDENNDDDDDAAAIEDLNQKAGLLVTLCNGRYQVDLEKMEQVNLESQMLRFVKRVPVFD